MSQQIYEYKLYLYGKDEEPMVISQEQGQMLAMLLSSDPNRKFILIGDDVVNTSAIKTILKTIKMKQTTVDGKLLEEHEIRELTESEASVQQKYLEFTHKKLLS